MHFYCHWRINCEQGTIMEFIKEELDSIAFDANVLKIENIDTGINFKNFEENYTEIYNPVYVYARIPIEQLHCIHYLEKNGFNYIETQFKMTKRLVKKEDLSLFNNEYELIPVTNKEDLPFIHSLSDEIMKADRVYQDAEIDKNIAKKRYHLYINKSFNSKNENIFKTRFTPDDKIIGFHTNMMVDSKNILFFIGGILPEYRNSGACFAHSYLIYNYLLDRGYKNITTHISAANYNIINLEMRTLGFKPKQTYVIMRKLYKQ